MGAPPQLGFDVACFDRATGEELWRVVWEGREIVGTVKRNGKTRLKYKAFRRKVYPDGSEERFDGECVFRTSKDTQVMRITPTIDRTKLAAVKTLFHKYATEAVTFYDLAKWLNKLGVRNAAGNKFQGARFSRLFADESYLGYPTFNKRGRGRFHRYDKEGGVVELESGLAGKERTNAPEDVVRCSTRLFDPIIDRDT